MLARHHEDRSHIRDAGVSIDAGNAFVDLIKPLVRGTARPGADGTIGGFGGVFDLGALNYADPLLVAANDGVGTKLKLAIETGIHETVGIDLVAMCVNDLVVQGAEPLFFLDYYATGALDPEEGARIVAGIAAGCREAGCALSGGETAEMPGMYTGDDYDLAGFAVGIVERTGLLPRDIREGDAILGLPSSGLHSNGFSLVRRVIETAGLDLKSPCPWQRDVNLGEALLEPTRIYVRDCLAAKEAKGFAHITGGGLPENLPRVLPEGLGARIDLDAWTPPDVFGWLSRTGNISSAEMLRTFNCGIGMVAIVAEADADASMTRLSAQRIGTVTVRNDEPVTFTGSLFA